MKRIVVVMQNALVSEVVTNLFKKCDLIYEKSLYDTPEGISEMCEMFLCDILFMDVTRFGSGSYENRIETINIVKKHNPNIKICMICDNVSDGEISYKISAGVTVIGGYIYIRSNYNIDLFNTIGQLKTLPTEVDESKLCPNAFSDDDMKSVKSKMDKYIKDLISYDSNKGYKVNIPPQTPPTSFSDDFILSSKEAGALS